MKSADLSLQSEEARLVQKLRSSKSAAMDELYTTYRNRLYSMILGRVGGDRSAAEDLVQEVFLAALSSLDNFRGESQFYTWLRSIAVHKINDYYRRQARQPEADTSAPDFTETQLDRARDHEPATLTMMETAETRQSVHRALVGLPRDYRRVLVLKYLDEMPVLEISRIMGRSPKSIEGLLSRARQAMRNNLSAEDRELTLQPRR
ncbi:MAG: RNA polymerase sigma factor [Dehalococcoidia bacterium]|nr:RNA polymerase sigma factor [Dehalococcoidia bacterium]